MNVHTHIKKILHFFPSAWRPLPLYREFLLRARPAADFLSTCQPCGDSSANEPRSLPACQQSCSDISSALPPIKKPCLSDPWKARFFFSLFYCWFFSSNCRIIFFTKISGAHYSRRIFFNDTYKIPYRYNRFFRSTFYCRCCMCPKTRKWSFLQPRTAR